MMKKQYTLLTLLLLLIYVLLPMTAWSDNGPQSLDPLVVTAEKEDEPPASPYRISESSKAASWSVGRKEIEEIHPATVYDIFAQAPGVHICFQGRKGMNFTEARGGGRYAFLLDGIYIPWTQASRVLADIPVSTIESVQVVRDGTVLTLAPLAEMGLMNSSVQGVIMIKTRKPERTETEAAMGGGNLGRFNAHLWHGGHPGNFTYSMAYNKRHDGGRDGWNNASDSDSVFLKGGYAASGFTADMMFYYDWASRQIQRSTDDSLKKISDARWKYDPLETLMVSARFGKAWENGQTTSLGLYTGRVDTELHTGSYTVPGEKVTSQDDHMTQADLRHVIAGDRNLLRIGGQAIFWETPTGQFYYETIPRKEQLYSLYVQDDYEISDRLTADAGVRVERKHISEGVDRYVPGMKTTSLIRDEWAEPAYCLSAGTAWWAKEEVCRLSFRTAYTRQGTESFVVTANDRDLGDEERWKYEAGITAMLHPALRPTLTLFCYDIRNLKISVDTATVGDDLVNVYDAIDVVRKGLELDMGGRLFFDPLTYHLTYTWQTSDNDDDDRALPRHMASLRLGYRFDPVQVSLMAKYVAEYESNFFAKDGQYHDVGDFTQIDANISYGFKLDKCDAKITIYGRNLTDERYVTRLGWEDNGLTYGAEMSIRF